MMNAYTKYQQETKFAYKSDATSYLENARVVVTQKLT